MHIVQGRSFEKDSVAVIAEVTESWGEESRELDVVFVYCSTEQEPGELARGFQERFPGAIVVGATTTGEHLSGAHSRGSCVVTGLRTPGIRWAAEVVHGITAFDDDKGRACADALFEALGVEREDFDPEEYFAMLFIDGLRAKEEVVAMQMADALEGVRMVGGSAGDDLKFEQTVVVFGGQAHTDAAVVVLAHSEVPFEIFKHQHFTTESTSLVVTKADPVTRTVYEFDGYPAAERYAAVLGLEPEQLDNAVFSMNPLTFRCNDEIYVRSLGGVDLEAGTISFYCAIEEGMVLELGGHHDMEQELEAQLGGLAERMGSVEFMMMWNCVFRMLEAQQSGAFEALGRVLGEVCPTSMAFDTYGEQLDGLHINQTLVGIAFQKAA